MDPSYDLLDILMTDKSAEQASDKIKKINSLKPEIAQSMFGNIQDQESEED